MATNKVPPHSDSAEKSVLGSILMDRDAIVQVSEFLLPDYFYAEKHGDIYGAMLSLFESREPIDLVTLPQKLKSQKLLERIGGVTYLSSLVEGVPSSANVRHYGEIIQGYYARRKLIADASNLIEQSFDEGIKVTELLDTAEQKVYSLSQANLKQGFLPIRSILAESFDRLDELSKKSGSLRGVASGFTDLDNCLAGMQDSNLLILAARPGMGKTAFSLNIAQFASVVSKVPVGYFSLEMSKEELVDRMLVAQADIDAWRLKTGKLSQDDFSKLSEAMGVLAEAPLYIDDTPGISVMEMRTKARRLKSEHQLELIIVDYLQLVKGRNLENRVQEVGEISQGLKNLARELKVPVLALSQLSRSIEHRGSGSAPQLSDLRESGSIEQDADVVMFLYREDVEDLESVKLSIAKHRNGPLRTIDLKFRGERVKFYGMDKSR
ncbi:TPA: replicative DNA helicase [Candidatus Collierbacteria bacterium]|uniref:Replicative DNA helicase n=2 Tax=Candidatus Collieribacteriota TaxID=1752725 RepID=A0A1F5FYR4_9BACT|nr:MAG: Replicative DNA helicase [Microgenomates group bacterium GW2011_GWF1_46_12]KKU27696.1 MAG: Replicative DNA helicase [Microgenomates group bacterium GW2011_GWF2_46_18]KKU43350.1 MAG: Replicative DNA helicase [Microgenomates group bacterium GW2011_GWA1_46_7]KKU44837.1 MAG: Replicative DNA helicase [Microgenomates group bacterium GW2011_GWB1_46_7]KKU60605.1 MAG: Replicative DNA helicase [Microgenomates group bacterium GW2011_GWE1_47_12]OGD69818.1 MAG: replicative DNA helicase [Candidatus 